MAHTDRIPYHTKRDTIPNEHHHHFEAISESRGSVQGPFSVLMNSPEFADRVSEVGAYARFESELSDVTRELAIITTAREFDCAYEWAAHAEIAREVGVPKPAIETVAERTSTDQIEERNRIIIDYGRELFGRNEITDETYKAAFEWLGESGVTDLTGTIGYYAMIAIVLNAFEVTPEDDRPKLP